MSPKPESKAPRLYVEAPLDARTVIDLESGQVHYLVNVMRLKPGDPVLLFNGSDGEWLGDIVEAGRRTCQVKAVRQSREQTVGGDIHYLFAPLKRARLDYMAQKATELGASVLQPVLTAHTRVERIKGERLRANAIEAAEQCGILSVPEIRAPQKLERLLETWNRDRRIIYCDEWAPQADPIASLRDVRKGPLAVLIGPEGGFSEAERRLLGDQDYVKAISLGPRIMRADTAAISALTLVQAVLGDLSETKN